MLEIKDIHEIYNGSVRVTMIYKACITADERGKPASLAVFLYPRLLGCLCIPTNPAEHAGPTFRTVTPCGI